MDGTRERSPAAGRASRGRAAADAPVPAVRYRAVALPSGELLPIEERLGRRVLRRIDPASPEGRRLLAARRVVIVDASRESGPAARDH